MSAQQEEPSGYWITTAWGSMLPMDGMLPGHLSISGIAEVLAKHPRWAGHTPGRFISVADHSVWVSDVAGNIAEGRFSDKVLRYIALAALLHDCHEVVICDRPRPVMRWEWEYAGKHVGINSAAGLAYRFDAALHKLVGLPHPLPAEWQDIVREADQVVFSTEHRDFMPKVPGTIHGLVEPLSHRLEPSASWEDARDAFMTQYNWLVAP